MCTLFQIWFSFSRFLRSHEFENYISVGYYVFPLELSVSYSNHVWPLFLTKCCDQFQCNSSFWTQTPPHMPTPPLKKELFTPTPSLRKLKGNTVPTNMFAPTPSPQGSGNQSNQERKKERCPHGYRGPVVGEKINTVHKIEMFKKIWIDEIMSRIIRCWILYAIKMMKIVEVY